MSKSFTSGSGGGGGGVNIGKAGGADSISNSTAPGSSITSSTSSSNVISQPTNVANSGACDSGSILCPVFGCVQGTQCPLACSARISALTCTGSINGHGCKWVSNTCVEDRQCQIAANGTCPTGCQGCGVFQCVNQGLQCPVMCPLLPQAGCGKAATVNGLGCAWVAGQCVVWDAINGGMLGAGRIIAAQYVPPVLSPAESAKLFPPLVPTTTTTSSTTSSTLLSVTPTLTLISSSVSSSQPSASPTTLAPEKDSQQVPGGKKPKGMSSGAKAVLVILVMAICDLLSWCALYYLTRDKVNFHQPSSQRASQKVLPIYNGSAVFATTARNNSSSRNSYGNMSTL
ncbi:hypothetical protein IWW47_000037 [Coemansia sp. RSA 2052]|nr:hypothetical protein IWW47_000037 [Coemansia sp. RSA 2052]